MPLILSVKTVSAAEAKAWLQRQLLLLAFVNLLLVALVGLFLRSFPFLSSFALQYKNVLHSHSHFAFVGWVLPVLVALVMKNFPELKERIAFHHWRNIALLILLSAYGMLLSFPFQGYKAVSIAFSTLSILATFYLAIVVWKAIKGSGLNTSHCFLKWGLIYAVVSAIGPFATGPVIAKGMQGSTIYFDLIYYYLHFQYNGFFTFTVFAFLYRLLAREGHGKNGREVFLLLNVACFPTYALSILWHEPFLGTNIIGGAGAVLQVLAVGYLVKDLKGCTVLKKSFLFRLSSAAFALKVFLQLASAVPFIAAMAYQNRNFVIAYLHLVLLGFVTLFVFANTLPKNKSTRLGVRLFLFSFFTTEVLLVANALGGLLHFYVPQQALLLFSCSVFFPAGVMMLLFGMSGNKLEETNEAVSLKTGPSPLSVGRYPFLS